MHQISLWSLTMMVFNKKYSTMQSEILNPGVGKGGAPQDNKNAISF